MCLVGIVMQARTMTPSFSQRQGTMIDGRWEIVLVGHCVGGMLCWWIEQPSITISITTHPPPTNTHRPYSFMVYAPSRTVVVYAPSEYVDAHADQLATGVAGLGVKGLGPYFEP